VWISSNSFNFSMRMDACALCPFPIIYTYFLFIYLLFYSALIMHRVASLRSLLLRVKWSFPDDVQTDDPYSASIACSVMGRANPPW